MFNSVSGTECHGSNPNLETSCIANHCQWATWYVGELLGKVTMDFETFVANFLLVEVLLLFRCLVWMVKLQLAFIIIDLESFRLNKI